MKENEEEDERITYLRCSIAYYEHCAKTTGNEADATRAAMLKIALDDFLAQGRVALTINRLKRFLPVKQHG